MTANGERFAGCGGQHTEKVRIYGRNAACRRDRAALVDTRTLYDDVLNVAKDLQVLLSAEQHDIEVAACHCKRR